MSQGLLFFSIIITLQFRYLNGEQDIDVSLKTFATTILFTNNRLGWKWLLTTYCLNIKDKRIKHYTIDVRVTDAIGDSLVRYIDTFSLTLNIPDKLVNDVIGMWTFNQGKLLNINITEEKVNFPLAIVGRILLYQIMKISCRIFEHFATKTRIQ